MKIEKRTNRGDLRIFVWNDYSFYCTVYIYVKLISKCNIACLIFNIVCAIQNIK